MLYKNASEFFHQEPPPTFASFPQLESYIDTIYNLFLWYNKLELFEQMKNGVKFLSFMLSGIYSLFDQIGWGPQLINIIIPNYFFLSSFCSSQ